MSNQANHNGERADKSPQKQDALVSKGVDELIARLRDEGVNHGEQQAAEIVKDAKHKAQLILEKAKQDSQIMLADAREQAAEYKAAGESAIKTAMRDMVLQLKLDLTREFSEDLKRLVSHQLQQPDMLEKMILELVGRTAESTDTKQAEQVEIVLPEHVIGLDELRNNPDALGSGQLMDFVFGLTRDMLQDGVQFKADDRDELSSGIRVKLTDHNLELDLTEQAVASILLQHLQPRFRAILEGVVR